MINKVTVTEKKKREYLKVEHSQVEVSKDGQQFDAVLSKRSNQLMSRELSDAFMKLRPHLLYATELTSKEIILDEKLDARAWFNGFKFEEEERFSGLKITKIEFIGNDDIIDSVKLYGYRETQETDKGFKVPLETPVINLDRTKENHYALVVILEEQILDLHNGVVLWLEKGETLTKAQQAMFEKQEA